MTTAIESQPETASKPLLTEKDLAHRWSCSAGWLANRRSRGDGPPFVRVGTKAIRYRLADIERYEQVNLAGVA